MTETARWRLTKTWITDPARATVLARIRFVSLTGKPLRLYVLADPAPGDDGNDDRGMSRGNRLIAFDDAAASVVAAKPALGGPPAATGAPPVTRGRTSRPTSA